MDRLTELGAVLGQLLKDRGETIAIAESSTGGLVSAALLAVPGASNYFMGGGIIYTRAARRDYSNFPSSKPKCAPRLKITPAVLPRIFAIDWAPHGASARAALQDQRVTVTATHPVATTCIALVGPVSQAMTLETGSNVRKTNMWRFAEETILFAQRTIAEMEKLC